MTGKITMFEIIWRDWSNKLSKSEYFTRNDILHSYNLGTLVEYWRWKKTDTTQELAGILKT